MSNPVGSILILVALLFIIYRTIKSINDDAPTRSDSGASPPGSEDFPEMDLESIARDLPDESSAPPPISAPAQMTLERSEERLFAGVELSDQLDRLMAASDQFDLLGEYAIKEFDGYCARVFSHREISLVAILYKDQSGETWLNFLSAYEDGRVITTSSAPPERFAKSRPRGMPLYNHEGFPPDQLLRRHKLEIRGAKTAQPTTAENLADFFNANYQKLRAHLVELDPERFSTPERDAPLRGARSVGAEPSAEELARWLNEIIDRVNPPPSELDRFVKGLIWARADADAESVLETLRERVGLTFRKVGADKIVISSPADSFEDIIDARGLKGAALFEKINEAAPDSRRLFKIPMKVSGVVFYSAVAPDFK